jgi:hypothetical protein
VDAWRLVGASEPAVVRIISETRLDALLGEKRQQLLEPRRPKALWSILSEGVEKSSDHPRTRPFGIEPKPICE